MEYPMNDNLSNEIKALNPMDAHFSNTAWEIQAKNTFNYRGRGGGGTKIIVWHEAVQCLTFLYILLLLE